jgi:replicative DNA helicase
MGATPKATWRLDGPNGSMAPRSAIEVLVDLNDKVTSGRVGEYQPVPLGFTPMDKTIGGGMRAGELLLIGGAQGTGKTTMALQMARNVASGGQANVLYICFEHDELYLLNRLIAAESALAHLPHKTGAIKIQDVRKEILGTWMAEGGGAAQLAANPRLRPSLDRIAR